MAGLASCSEILRSVLGQQVQKSTTALQLINALDRCIQLMQWDVSEKSPDYVIAVKKNQPTGDAMKDAMKDNYLMAMPLLKWQNLTSICYENQVELP